MSDSDILGRLMAALPTLKDFHAATDEPYQLLSAVARAEVVRRFAENEATPRPFPPFGELIFPYTSMGAIDSLDLFALDELIILAFYWLNRGRYRRTLDLGANLGLHSIAMARCGFDVIGFEPDPVHFKHLTRNIAANGAATVRPTMAAVSTTAGTMEFVRVLGNTTGSHLAGAKANVYGDIERISVRVEPFTALIEGIDLVKMDVEGHESAILATTRRFHWQTMDAVCEIGSADNARMVFEHFRDIGVGLFAQKIGWGRVVRVEDMPTSHREGTLFISLKPAMPWGVMAP